MAKKKSKAGPRMTIGTPAALVGRTRRRVTGRNKAPNLASSPDKLRRYASS